MDRGATPEEAANAAAKAQAMLFEHNLSMSQVDTHELPNEKTEEIENIEMEIEGGSSVIRWKRALLHAVARHNFCKAITLSGTSDVAVVGRRSNVIVVEYMSEYLEKEITRLAKNAAKEVEIGRPAFVSSFCIGAVVTVSKRLEEQAKESEKASPQSMALVVQTNAALEKAFKEFWPDVRKGRRTRIKDADGYAKGMKAGHSIGLRKAVGSSRQGALQIA